MGQCDCMRLIDSATSHGILISMKQSSLDLNLSTKKIRKQELQAQMDRVVPWAALVELIAPCYAEGKNGRPPFALEAVLRIHCMQQWLTLLDLAMEEAVFDTPIYREFAGLDAHGRLPDESTFLRFRHRLEKHKLADQILANVNELLAVQCLLLKAGTAVDATLIAAPSAQRHQEQVQKARSRDALQPKRATNGTLA
jgi:transposase, IS5 family